VFLAKALQVAVERVLPPSGRSEDPVPPLARLPGDPGMIPVGRVDDAGIGISRDYSNGRHADVRTRQAQELRRLLLCEMRQQIERREHVHGMVEDVLSGVSQADERTRLGLRTVVPCAPSVFRDLKSA
jgi:hypothetical protein